MALESVVRGQQVVLDADMKGVYTAVAGKQGEVITVWANATQATVRVEGQPYVVLLANLNAPPKPSEEITTGQPHELIGRIGKLGDQLGDLMQLQGIEGLGDGARWRADFEDGKLVIRQVSKR